MPSVFLFVATNELPQQLQKFTLVAISGTGYSKWGSANLVSIWANPLE